MALTLPFDHEGVFDIAFEHAFISVINAAHGDHLDIRWHLLLFNGRNRYAIAWNLPVSTFPMIILDNIRIFSYILSCMAPQLRLHNGVFRL